MFQAHLQDGLHMIVCQGVEHILAIPTEFDQVHLLQNPQLVGDGALAQFNRVRDFRHAQFLILQEQDTINYLETNHFIKLFIERMISQWITNR